MKAFFFSTSPYRCSYYSSPVMARNKKYEKQKACYFLGNDPPRITSNVKQNLQFLRLWKEFQKKNASTPKPATSYHRRKVQKEVLPEDEELYEDPTTTLYYTH